MAAVLARHERKEHPRGAWQNGLWWPDPQERRACCETIQPTPANKQALESHCRSQAHIAQLFGVSGPALRRAALAVRRQRARASRPFEPPAGSPAVMKPLLAATWIALQNAKAALCLELERLAPLLDPELAAEAETLADLLAEIEKVAKRLVLVRQLVEMCREARAAEQVYRQLQPPGASA